MGHLVEELRVPLVHLKYKRSDASLALSIQRTIAEPSAVLEPRACASLIRFARVLGIDFGELDAIRDHADGRLYVFDANNTPCVRLAGVSAADRRPTVEKLAEAFDRAFLRRQ